jgi:foldase protein PrsA
VNPCKRCRVFSSVTTALVLACLVLVVAAAPGAARSDSVFTVTAPTGTYTTSTAEHARWARVARRSGATRTQARWQAFELLLSYAWLEAEAAERGITLAPEVVDRELEASIIESFRTKRAFRRYLRETGQTAADIKLRVRIDLLSNMIREQVIAPIAGSVTEADVDEYIAEFGHIRVPERRDIRVVLTKRRDAAVQARRELLQGRSWRSVARRYSIDAASRFHGGRLPDQVPGTLERRLDRAVFSARRGRITGPVRTRSGFYVFRVSRIEPEHFLSEAASRRIIRRQLVVHAEQAELDRFVAGFGAKWRSRTVCAEEYRASPNCANHATAGT